MSPASILYHVRLQSVKNFLTLENNMESMLSLTQAAKENRLPEFIAQEEARGIGPIDKNDFVSSLSSLIKSPRSEDQT